MYYTRTKKKSWHNTSSGKTCWKRLQVKQCKSHKQGDELAHVKKLSVAQQTMCIQPIAFAPPLHPSLTFSQSDRGSYRRIGSLSTSAASVVYSVSKTCRWYASTQTNFATPVRVNFSIWTMYRQTFVRKSRSRQYSHQHQSHGWNFRRCCLEPIQIQKQ